MAEKRAAFLCAADVHSVFQNADYCGRSSACLRVNLFLKAPQYFVNRFAFFNLNFGQNFFTSSPKDLEPVSLRGCHASLVRAGKIILPRGMSIVKRPGENGRRGGAESLPQISQ